VQERAKANICEGFVYFSFPLDQVCIRLYFITSKYVVLDLLHTEPL